MDVLSVDLKRRSFSKCSSAGSSDDSNYVSYKDNESVSMDSDDEYAVHQKSANEAVCSASTRMQSFRNGGKVFRNASSTSSSRTQIERQPTRRPNPKILNRNALMARENRKKKKQHLETLERNVENLKDENKTLRLKLKKRSYMVHKLRDEGLYLKSIIANKTSIMTLLKTIQGNTLPITSSNVSFMTDHDERSSENVAVDHRSHFKTPAITSHSCSSSPSSSSLLSGGEDDEKENDLDHLDYSHHSSIAEDDNDMKLDSWESLLNDDSPFHTKCTNTTTSTEENVELLSTVSSEHNYFNNNLIEQTNADEPGICLHLSGGRISMEFCASCHRHSQNAWIEEL